MPCEYVNIRQIIIFISSYLDRSYIHDIKPRQSCQKKNSKGMCRWGMLYAFPFYINRLQ
jgi:hypothetical protein